MSERLIEALQRRSETGETFREIAKRFGVNPNTLRRRAQLLNLSKPRTPTETRRVVVLSDIHARPSWEILDKAITIKPDTVILAGDLFDGQQANPHETDLKFRARTFAEESKVLERLMRKLLAETDAIIKVIRGNHDDWFSRMLSRQADRAFHPYIIDPLEAIVKRLNDDRLTLVRQTFKHRQGDWIEELAESRYCWIEGDAFISHMNFGGKWAGDAVKKLYEFYQRWQHTLGLSPRLFIQAHGHKQALLYHDGGNVLLAEIGACAKPSVESYKLAQRAGGSPMVQGGCTFEQVRSNGKWRTLLGSFRFLDLL